MTTYSANEPGRCTPTPTLCRQRCRRPARQFRQKPQVTCPSPETRSPGRKASTSAPTRSTRPTYSWPTIIGTGTVRWLHSSQL